MITTRRDSSAAVLQQPQLKSPKQPRRSDKRSTSDVFELIPGSGGAAMSEGASYIRPVYPGKHLIFFLLHVGWIFLPEGLYGILSQGTY